MRDAFVVIASNVERERSLAELEEIIRAQILGDAVKDDGRAESLQASIFGCSHCKSAAFKRRGFDAKGRQRFQCKSCNRSFTICSSSALSSTNLSPDTWMAFAACHVDAMSLRKSAEICGVSLQTAFAMRRRLNTALAEVVENTGKLLKQGQTYGETGVSASDVSSERALRASTVALALRRGKDGVEYCVDQAPHAGRIHAASVLSRKLVGHALLSLCEEVKCKLSNSNSKVHGAFARFLKRFRGVAVSRMEEYLSWFMFLKLGEIRSSALELAGRAIAKLESLFSSVAMLVYELPTQPFTKYWVARLSYA